MEQQLKKVDLELEALKKPPPPPDSILDVDETDMVLQHDIIVPQECLSLENIVFWAAENRPGPGEETIKKFKE